MPTLIHVLCRFMIECRYSASGSATQSLTSVGFMVKTPSSSLPSAISSDGLYSVLLRIATGKIFSYINSTWMKCTRGLWLRMKLWNDHVQSHRPNLLELLPHQQPASAAAPGRSSVPWAATVLFKTRSSASSELLYSLPSLCNKCTGAGLWRVRGFQSLKFSCFLSCT